MRAAWVIYFCLMCAVRPCNAVWSARAPCVQRVGHTPVCLRRMFGFVAWFELFGGVWNQGYVVLRSVLRRSLLPSRRCCCPRRTLPLLVVTLHPPPHKDCSARKAHEYSHQCAVFALSPWATLAGVLSSAPGHGRMTLRHLSTLRHSATYLFKVVQELVQLEVVVLVGIGAPCPVLSQRW